VTDLAHTDGASSVITDELTWELVRDEWDLLLAVGSGPTQASAASRILAQDEVGVADRLLVLSERGLVRQGPGGYHLTPLVHQRQESMSSYLRDLVLSRLEMGPAPPIAGATRDGILGGPALLRTAEEGLFPRIVEAASGPESERSERFLCCVAIAQNARPQPDDEEFPAGFLRVLKAAAVERCHPDRAAGAKLWVAEMRVDPEIAVGIGEALEGFIEEVPSGGSCSATVVVLPTRGRGERGKQPC
jgi:hypothetical protein